MKRVFGLGLAALALMFCTTAKAWDCPAGQIRQQAPAGTPTTTPYYDVVEGIAFICVPATPPVTPTTPSSTATSSSNSTSNANSSSTSNSNAGATATGGNSTSTAQGGQGGSATATGGKGGSATGGNATGGNVANSGNSSNTNTNTAQGGQGGQGGKGGNATGGTATQGQTQSQSLTNSGNSTASASNNGTGNGNNSNDSTTNISTPRQVATAFAPSVTPTAPCIKGFGAAGQTGFAGLSFGGSKVDVNCAILEASRLAPSLLAKCKVYISNKYVKAAGVSLADCLQQEQVTVEQGPATPVELPTPAPQPIITINVPAPVVTIIPQPVQPAPINVVAAARANSAAKPVVHHKCYTEEELKRLGVIKQ